MYVKWGVLCILYYVCVCVCVYVYIYDVNTITVKYGFNTVLHNII